MTTPILSIAEVLQSQANKEATINDAIRALENATQANRTQAITAATTLTTDQFTDYFYHTFTGTFGATTLTVPNTQRLFYVKNNTNGALTVRAGSFAVTTVVAAGSGTLLYCDGSDEVTAVGGAGSGGAQHVIGTFFSGDGVDENAELIYVFTRAVDFADDMPLCKAFADVVAATGSVVFDLQKNGSSIGTLTFAVSTATGTFATTTATSFAVGDRLHVVCPAAFDSLAGIAITFMGTLP